MSPTVCEFFAGSIAEWLLLLVTFLTGVAIAALAYQSNAFNQRTKRETDLERRQRARNFGLMISVEVGSAQNAFYNIRCSLKREVDGTRIPDLDAIRRANENLKHQFLPHVSQGFANVDLLPETCAKPIFSGMASIETVRRCLAIVLSSPSNVVNNVLTPAGMANIEGVCHLLMSAETHFFHAHRALWAFDFPDVPVNEWEYPEGAIIPPRLLRSEG